MYSLKGRVRYSECDENGRLSLVGMINYLQDCSTFHSEEVAEGLRGLGKEGLGWILAAWRIEIDRLPGFGENIEVKTWSYEMKSLHAMRNYELFDQEGRSCVRAESQWLLYSFKENRIIRIPESQKVYLENTPRIPMPKMERKLKVEGEGMPTHPIIVGEQHLDTNKHVNNAQYVLMAFDALAEAGIVAPLDTLSVQYRDMAYLGDVIVPSIHECENGKTVSLTDGNDAIYAIVRFQERDSQ